MYEDTKMSKSSENIPELVEFFDFDLSVTEYFQERFQDSTMSNMFMP